MFFLAGGGGGGGGGVGFLEDKVCIRYRSGYK